MYIGLFKSKLNPILLLIAWKWNSVLCFGRVYELHIHVDSLVSLQMQCNGVSRTQFEKAPRKHFGEFFMKGKLDGYLLLVDQLTIPVNYSGYLWVLKEK